MSMQWRGGAKSTNLLTAMFLLASAATTAALAQAPPSPSDGWDNAYYQILAESLRRSGRGKWVYTSDGHAIGRIVDVRTTPDGQHEAAVIRVRRLFGGGEIAIPFYSLSRQNSRIVSKDDRTAVLSMDRLDAAPGARR